jgi:hypothetical protein
MSYVGYICPLMPDATVIIIGDDLLRSKPI